MAIPTFDIGSLTALWTIFVFMALKRVVQVVLKRTILILKWSLYNVQFCKRIPENIHTPLTEGLEFPGGEGWGFFKEARKGF